MPINKQSFRPTLTDKLSEVTVAQSQLHGTAEGCLVIGSEQIVNLAVLISDNKEVEITGLFFNGLTSSDILDELSTQVTLDATSFNTVIFSPSCSDIETMEVKDIDCLSKKLRDLFGHCNLFICDYLYSPQQICLGNLSKIKQLNQSIGDLEIPMLNISACYLENILVSPHDLPIPFSDNFVELDNQSKSKLTSDSLVVTFSFLLDSKDFVTYPLLNKHGPLPSSSTKKLKVTRWIKVRKQRNRNSKKSKETDITTASLSPDDHPPAGFPTGDQPSAGFQAVNHPSCGCPAGDHPSDSCPGAEHPSDCCPFVDHPAVCCCPGDHLATIDISTDTMLYSSSGDSYLSGNNQVNNLTADNTPAETFSADPSPRTDTESKDNFAAQTSKSWPYGKSFYKV